MSNNAAYIADNNGRVAGGDHDPWGSTACNTTQGVVVDPWAIKPSANDPFVVTHDPWKVESANDSSFGSVAGHDAIGGTTDSIKKAHEEIKQKEQAQIEQQKAESAKQAVEKFNYDQAVELVINARSNPNYSNPEDIVANAAHKLGVNPSVFDHIGGGVRRS